MKKLSVVLIILFIGILVCGCTTQPAKPAATPAPTAAPTTIAPTAAPTTIAPTPVPANVTVNVTKTATPTPTPENVVTLTFTETMILTPDATITVPVGTKVVWVNKDPFKPHGVRSIGASAGLFDSGSLAYGQSYSYKCSKVGPIDYETMFQPYIVGKITVK